MSRSENIRKLGALYEEFAKDSQEGFILFADLCGSTAYKQQLMDKGFPASIWLHRQLIFLQDVSDHLQNNGGKIIKTIGDAVMAWFDYSESAEEIICSCIELNILFGNLKAFRGDHKIEVKISLDYGETINGSVISGSFDPLGICIDRCARLNSKANAKEIVFSANFNDKLKINDKKNIHNGIKDIQQKRENIKGLGNLVYYKLSL